MTTPSPAYTLATRIAPHLSPAPGITWTVVDPRENDTCVVTGAARIQCSNGAGLWLTVDRSRAEVVGSFPTMSNGRMYSTNREEYARISFDLTRDPKILAREIERRCLATYLPAFHKAVDYIKRDTIARDAALATAERIAALFPDTDAPRVQSDGSAKIWLHLPAVYCVTVHPEDNGPRVKFEIKTSETVAATILSILKGAAE